MKIVGLTTFYNGNYGSVLQCYATKRIIEKMGYKCDVLEESYKGNERYFYLAQKALVIGTKTVIHPGFLKKYNSIRNASYASINSISQVSNTKISHFANTILQPKKVSYSLMSEISKEDSYIAFITGSDQVWNCSNGLFNRMFFLRYAPKNKRVAFAPSFGTNEVNPFAKNQIRNAIAEFEFISVRESAGQSIISELTGLEIPCISDPTIMLTSKEWEEFGENGIKLSSKYIFVHFLDEPNTFAIDAISCILAEKKCKVVCFAYHQEKIEGLPGSEFFDGSPYDYVSLIKNAESVFTDSFHTASFSLYFHKQFYIFERNYRHGVSQGSRIQELLKKYDLTDRLICNKNTFKKVKNIELKDCNEQMAIERSRTLGFLKQAISKCDKEIGKINESQLLKDRMECTGCGACIAVCPKQAISFNSTGIGYELPSIDTEKCISCKRCEQVCKAEEIQWSTSKELSAYIAYNTDTKLRDISASGGMFSALASYVLQNGGVVCGACLRINSYGTSITHELVEDISQLPALLKSKYVQSDCSQVYNKVKIKLDKGIQVLFCGTSCQVMGLYKYLGQKKYENLYTVDLICHGVPGRNLFQGHLDYLKKKYDGEISNFDFRKKTEAGIEYIENFTITKCDGTAIQVEIPFNKSIYYKMFIESESYRDSCYHCDFASLVKPADITIGDYFEAKEDYPDLFKNNRKLCGVRGLSCIITRTDKGERLISSCRNVERIKVDPVKVQASHPQLIKPNDFSRLRIKVENRYLHDGYAGVVKYFKKKEFIELIPKYIRSLLRK